MYPSAHGVVQAAAAVVMKHYFGPNYSFETTAPSAPGVRRLYQSVDAYIEEGALARILGGMHFPPRSRKAHDKAGAWATGSSDISSSRSIETSAAEGFGRRCGGRRVVKGSPAGLALGVKAIVRPRSKQTAQQGC
jgi:hypothetical protein